MLKVEKTELAPMARQLAVYRSRARRMTRSRSRGRVLSRCVKLSRDTSTISTREVAVAVARWLVCVSIDTSPK